MPTNEGFAYFGSSTAVAFELSTTFVGSTIGTLTTFLGMPRSLVAPALVEEGSVVTLTVTGPPGDLVAVLRAPRVSVSFAPLLYGTNLVGDQPVVTFHGTLPASGAMTIDVTLPDVPHGRQFQPWVFQSLQFDAQNSYLSSGSVVHVIEPGTLP